jgi:hypothetical protein
MGSYEVEEVYLIGMEYTKYTLDELILWRLKEKKRYME